MPCLLQLNVGIDPEDVTEKVMNPPQAYQKQSTVRKKLDEAFNPPTAYFSEEECKQPPVRFFEEN